MERLALAPDVDVMVGDCREALRTLPDESVHCCVTSPPYLGLRDYGVEGQIGLEPSLSGYVSTMVEVFREVRRVLRKDGTLWLNLGDAYNGSGGSGGDYGPGGLREGQPIYPGRREGGLKPKDLMGVPWRVAFALQASGWWLRSDIIWHKPNPMPASVTDRPTTAHEYLFLLTKSSTYYYDGSAIAESSIHAGEKRTVTGKGFAGQAIGAGRKPTGNAVPGSVVVVTPTRNRRDVWTIPTEPTTFAHFATFPRALVEPCVLAGTSPQCCPTCGAPWERIVEREVTASEGNVVRKKVTAGGTMLPDGARIRHGLGASTLNANVLRSSLGWRSTCTCSANDGSGRAVVLDPFAGSGTALMVAATLGRQALGIELNPAYVDIMRQRLRSAKAQRTLQLE